MARSAPWRLAALLSAARGRRFAVVLGAARGLGPDWASLIAAMSWPFFIEETPVSPI